jgi:hypothetical protein
MSVHANNCLLTFDEVAKRVFIFETKTLAGEKFDVQKPRKHFFLKCQSVRPSLSLIALKRLLSS